MRTGTAIAILGVSVILATVVLIGAYMYEQAQLAAAAAAKKTPFESITSLLPVAAGIVAMFI